MELQLKIALVSVMELQLKIALVNVVEVQLKMNVVYVEGMVIMKNVLEQMIVKIWMLVEIVVVTVLMLRVAIFNAEKVQII